MPANGDSQLSFPSKTGSLMLIMASNVHLRALPEMYLHAVLHLPWLTYQRNIGRDFRRLECLLAAERMIAMAAVAKAARVASLDWITWEDFVVLTVAVASTVADCLR
jgi:hypothetical protein